MEPGIFAMEYRIQDCLAWIPFIHGKHGSSTYLQKIIFSILWRKMNLWYMYLFVNYTLPTHVLKCFLLLH